MSSSPSPPEVGASSATSVLSAEDEQVATLYDIISGIRGRHLMVSPLPPLSAGVEGIESVPILSTEASEFAKLVFDNLDILKHIISFIGDKRFLFVSAVNRRFKQAYTEVYPACRTTEMYVSTVQLARFCWDEMDDYYFNTRKEETLCRSAAYHDCIPALHFLRSVNCAWDEKTCQFAAYNGHLNVLQWCRQNGCPWNSATCSAAANCNGVDKINVHGMNGLVLMQQNTVT